MKIQMRIPRKLYEQGLVDIRRRHSFAAERIGFYFGRIGVLSENEYLILISEYMQVPDTGYVEDRQCGARIDSVTIRNVMQKAMSQKYGAFHFHLHDWNGKAWFSVTDRKEQSRLIESFYNVMPTQAHGQIVFTQNSFAGLIRVPNSRRVNPVNTLSIIGTPLCYSTGDWYA